MYIKNATYKEVPTAGLTFPLAEGSVITVGGVTGIVEQNVAAAGPTAKLYIAVGGTIDLRSEANKNVSFTDEQVKALGSDFNFIPAKEIVFPDPVKPTFTVTFTKVFNTWGSDKTYTEINNAYLAGRQIIFAWDGCHEPASYGSSSFSASHVAVGNNADGLPAVTYSTMSIASTMSVTYSSNSYVIGCTSLEETGTVDGTSLSSSLTGLKVLHAFNTLTPIKCQDLYFYPQCKDVGDISTIYYFTSNYADATEGTVFVYQLSYTVNDSMQISAAYLDDFQIVIGG